MIEFAELILQFSAIFFAFLMIFLILSACLVGLERFFFLHQTRLKADVLFSGLLNLLKANKLGEALLLCEQTPGSLARVFKRMLLFQRDLVRGEAEYAMQIDWEVQLLERRFGSLALITKIFPSVGFLGTLSALLRGFWHFGEWTPYLSANALAGDVSVAFSLAIFGVAGGIFLNLLYHFLYGRLRGVVRDLRSVSRDLFCNLLFLREGSTNE